MPASLQQLERSLDTQFARIVRLLARSMRVDASDPGARRHLELHALRVISDWMMRSEGRRESTTVDARLAELLWEYEGLSHDLLYVGRSAPIDATEIDDAMLVDELPEAAARIITEGDESSI